MTMTKVTSSLAILQVCKPLGNMCAIYFTVTISASPTISMVLPAFQSILLLWHYSIVIYLSIYHYICITLSTRLTIADNLYVGITGVFRMR